jgi:O-methyltransferase domain
VADPDSHQVSIRSAEHNFFDEQPIKDAEVFLMRATIHDWGFSYAVKILRRLRDAAVVGKTKLLMIDNIIPYACKTPSDVKDDTILPPEPSVPDFMLPNVRVTTSQVID